jgi:AraC-like DNA-binding protein
MNKEGLYTRSYLQTDGFDEFILKLGGNPLALMHEAGLNTTPQKGRIQFVSWNAMVRYFELASRKLNEPYLGLKWVEFFTQDHRHNGPTLFLVKNATSVRHFLDLAIKYQTVHTNGVRYSYEDDTALGEARGIISIHPLSVPCRQFIEQIMGDIVVTGRRLIPNLKITRVTFQHNAPADLSMYQKIFNCAVEFNAERNMIVADREILHVEKSSAFTKFVSPLIETYFKTRQNRTPRVKQTLRLNIAEILPIIMGTNSSDVTQIAAALEMHPKKLQRLLKDEGTSYSEVLDDVRRNLAERLLEESDISIARVATMLDYTTDRSFTAAAKRWFGMSPTAYRAYIRQGN